ncbi:MAG: SUMF1/EgtB/PvdO family nonheme iron enzyme [Deltaproteobacteria bacterium]|nr:SUMF1/EgtB/PvdO family nonheme iron enzyme [Deltaproteobacteria bacterium]
MRRVVFRLLVCPVFLMILFGTDAIAGYYDRSYALVIGINKYPSPKWDDLDYARGDAEAVASFLDSQGFEVIPLYDRQATKTAIISRMQNVLARKVGKNDRVLVFFAGHGHTEPLSGKDWGYIVPYHEGNLLSASYISMEELQTQSRKMGNAKHQLFVMDACYGGLLGTKGSSVDAYPGYLKEVTRRVARQIITAGGKGEEVLDGGPGGHSVFVDHFLAGLKDALADTNGDGYITFAELTSYLVPSASNSYQTPAPGTLPGHGLGEFVFRSPKGITRITENSRTPPSSQKRRSQEPRTTVAMAPRPSSLEKGQSFTNSIGMKFVLIPSGTFMMGSPLNEPERFKDERQHRVTITKPFYMQTTEVTQGQWREVMGSNPSRFKDCGADCPVEEVFWNDAQEFIRKLNRKERADKYRLPTEAEWEYACRADSITRFCFGDSDGKLGEYAWYIGNSSLKTHSVGQKQPNVWGLYDMHGNVWEWVEDDWHENYKGAPTDGRAWIDEPRGSNRVIRGGSWNFVAQYCRSAIRYDVSPDNRNNNLGFRLSRSLP